MNSKGKPCRGQVQHLPCFILLCDPSAGLGNSFKGLLVTIGIRELRSFLQAFFFSFGVIPLLLQPSGAQKLEIKQKIFSFFFSFADGVLENIHR